MADMATICFQLHFVEQKKSWYLDAELMDYPRNSHTKWHNEYDPFEWSGERVGTKPLSRECSNQINIKYR